MARKPKASTLYIALGGVVGGLSGYFLGEKGYFLVVPFVVYAYFLIYRDYKR